MKVGKYWSQERIIINWLKKGKSINRDEAFKKWKVRRLGAIIFTLRENGWDIMTSLSELEHGIATYRLGKKRKSKKRFKYYEC